MSKNIDPLLFELAELQLRESLNKQAFVPSDPAGGGDPAAAGGAPPGGAPPGMDPSMGAAPPADPAAAGGTAGAAPPPFDPSTLGPMIQQAVQQAMGSGGTPNPAAPGGGPVGVGAKLKIDPTMVYLKLGRVEKLFLHMYEQMGWPIPPDTLNDDAMIQAATGQPASGATTPPGGAPPAGGDPAAAAGPQGMPGLPGTPAVNPIQPIDMGGGQAKTGFHALFADHDLGSAADVMGRLLE